MYIIINITTNDTKNAKNIYPKFLSIGFIINDEDEGDDEGENENDDDEEDELIPGANVIAGDRYSYILFCIFVIVVFLFFEVSGTKYTI